MLQLKVSNFRAIRSAEIDLPGITVLAGENGCGKSTISKFLYHTLFTAHAFNDIEKRRFSNQKMRLYHEGASATLDFVFGLKNKWPDIDAEGFFPKDDGDFSGYFDKVVRIINRHRIEKPNDENINLLVQRFSGALNTLAGDAVDARTGVDAINGLLEKVRALDADLEKTLQQRPLSLVYDRLRRILEDDFSTDCFDLQEMGVSIFNKKSERLGTPFDIKHVFYIDTPWAVDKDNSRNASSNYGVRLSHRTNLMQALRATDSFGSSVPILMDGVIGGRVGVKRDDTSWRFEFHRNDGRVFDLFHCATGVKAFSILQMLYHGGLLNKNTLLILDEPESHLHPQWIVEYARLIVLLKKQNNVRFMISSHSTDMVAAIQAIAQKEEVASDTKFYLAKLIGEEGCLFDYIPLDFNIGPIFESFNKSMEGIAKYGADID